MWKLIKNFVKVLLLLLIIALVFDLHYQGKSIRELAKDYGWKIASWLYTEGKSLVGKDLKDLTPSSISPKLENTLKILDNEADSKKNDVKKALEDNKNENKDQSKKSETQPSNVTKLDQLTEQDRAKLKELLDQKLKAN